MRPVPAQNDIARSPFINIVERFVKNDSAVFDPSPHVTLNVSACAFRENTKPDAKNTGKIQPGGGISRIALLIALSF